MELYTTTEAARRLGIGLKTLARYIEVKKVPAPKMVRAGKITIHAWTDEEIEHVRKLLPKIVNGRKTRWQRQRENEKRSAPAGMPAPHKKRKPKKK